MSTGDEVRQTSDQFYGALNRMLTGDAGPMMGVWSHSSEVTTMNPYGGREVGWEQIRAAWERAAQDYSGSQTTITLRYPLIRVVGDLAYEVGSEVGEVTFAGQTIPFEQRVTNVYRREARGWKMVHHHIDINPAEQERYRRLLSSKGHASS